MRVWKISVLLTMLLVVLGASAASAATRVVTTPRVRTVARVSVADLGDTKWRVVAYNVGKYNDLTRVRGDREIRLVFGKNGQISGTGVNAFTARFSATRSRTSRDSIAIRNAKLATRNAYANAEQRQQEQNVIRALSGATAYRMAGGQLDLLYANGRIAATLLTIDDQKIVQRQEAVQGSVTPQIVTDDYSHTQSRLDNLRPTVRYEDEDNVLLIMNGEVFHLNREQNGGRFHFVPLDDGTFEIWESDGENKALILRSTPNMEFMQN